MPRTSAQECGLSHELIADVGVDGLTSSRAGFSGSATFPCHWAGDDDSTWDGLRSSLRAGLSAGVVGICFWTWDMVGFSGPIPDAELYLRSAGISVFCEEPTRPLTMLDAEGRRQRDGEVAGLGTFRLHGAGCRFELDGGEDIDFDWGADGEVLFDS